MQPWSVPWSSGHLSVASRFIKHTAEPPSQCGTMRLMEHTEVRAWHAKLQSCWHFLSTLSFHALCHLRVGLESGNLEGADHCLSCAFGDVLCWCLAPTLCSMEHSHLACAQFSCTPILRYTLKEATVPFCGLMHVLQ